MRLAGEVNHRSTASPRRILYVHNSADIYGASRSLLRLLQTLDRSKFDPIVLVPEAGPLTEAVAKLNIAVFNDPSLAVISRYTSWTLELLNHFPLSVMHLLGLIRKHKVSLVHTNVAVAFSAAAAAKLARVPHVWHIRESFEEFKSGLWPIYSRYMQFLSDRIVAVSNATAAQFPDRRKVEVIHNGFSPMEFAVNHAELRRQFRQQFDIVETAVVVGCIGRIKWKRKGQEYLVQAAAALKSRGIAAKYLIVGLPYKGNESHLERLKQLAIELGVAKEVIFAGEIPDPKAAYCAMDIFVLPSAEPEPFAGVVMEAMALNLPVIATRIGGSTDQVEDGVTGFLVPPANAESIAANVEKLIRDAGLRHQMADAGKRRIASEFDLGRTVKRIEAMYSALLA